MCLDTVDKEIKVKEGIGWKVFVKDKSYHLKSLLQFVRIPIGVWVEDKWTGRLLNRYQTGFHLFPSRSCAQTYAYSHEIIRPVEFRNVTATGTSSLTPIIVAREIRIFTAKEAKEYDK